MTTDHLHEQMTPFERQVADALRIYADRPELRRPAAEVVADVRAAPARSRWWLMPAGIAAAVLLIAAGLAGIRALDGSASQVARATVDGVIYGVSAGTSLAFAPGDLMPMGEVSQTNAEDYFADRKVYAIRGVDPRRALVARQSDQATGAWGGEYLLLVGPGPGTADLCPYYTPDAVPDSCVREPPVREIP
jgi:hypothetical protein